MRLTEINKYHDEQDIFKRIQEEKRDTKLFGIVGIKSCSDNDLSLDKMNKSKDLILNRREAAIIRKLKDLGTEHIMLQTIIQLDGDISNRISKRFMQNYNERLLGLHDKSIEFSMSYWKSLADIAITILSKLFKNR